MEWNERYETGNEVVDSEHREIFSLVKKVLSDVFTDRTESIAASLEFLTDYTMRHFGHEESLMDESSYPEMDKHKRQHRVFARKVANLNTKLNGENCEIDISLEINETVVNWLVEHVLSSDKLLADHYKEWQNSEV